MARRFDDDEDEPHWIFKFLRGVFVSVVVCGAVLVVLSLYVLPPAELPPDPPADTGPKIVDGIEVSPTPAYTPPTVAETPAAAPEPAAAADPAAPAPSLPIDTRALEDPESPIRLSGPALTVNAAPFQAPEGVPLVAVVLDDTAADPFLHPVLFALKLPLTVGVVAGGGGDREIAGQARTAGMEVVAQLPLAAPGQGGGVALEPGLQSDEATGRTDLLLRRLPMSVAASRPLSSPGLPDPGTLAGMAGALSPHGFAYVDHTVRTGEQSLLDMLGLGLSVGVSRFAIPADASPADILAVLDQAAAEAGPDGGSVILAVPSQPLLEALQLWGGEGSVSAGALAPLSAVIARQAAR